ncbi:MAG TPA: Na-translocating system protein MpsB, partial [Candidatus Melainabacteria bacterium]|nr:Na-translocating system protein MpsB [Candidatus Melainabacteria bacterium]
RTCHTQLEWLINFEMIKWCEAFLDEGLASLPMPDREKGFYCVWKSLASKEWSPCGIPDSSRKIASLPWSPDEALALHLEALAIPPEVQQDYLSFELTSLYGWASFINWRADHADYAWQAAYPIDLVQYLAVLCSRVG